MGCTGVHQAEEPIQEKQEHQTGQSERRDLLYYAHLLSYFKDPSGRLKYLKVNLFSMAFPESLIPIGLMVEAADILMGLHRTVMAL